MEHNEKKEREPKGVEPSLGAWSLELGRTTARRSVSVLRKQGLKGRS